MDPVGYLMICQEKPVHVQENLDSRFKVRA